ncbi:NAD-dependent epimerase/dehydratase family protein [Streptomyces sp. NPDC059680]|uniref:NAD-dependent epimerase/dehydratase family protein n=1 Tax=Streptomyces sp. NPDC059680 TaxID=3346904 RepID=UPI0036CD9E5F
MKVLVTGASGFLGGHIVDGALRAGQQVRVLVRRGSDISRLRDLDVELAYGDLEDADSLHRATDGVDVVHHSAARVASHGTRAQFWGANVTGTERLMEAARSSGVRRFVFISSPSAVMDPKDGDRLGVDESVPYPGSYFNHYCETKAAAERLVRAANQRDFTTVTLRPRGIWGPRDYSGFLPMVIARLAAGTFPDLIGDRQVYASLCHCDNAVAAALLAATAPAERVGGKVYFVADRDPVEAQDLIERLTELFGGSPPTRRIPLALLEAVAGAVDLVWKIPVIAAHKTPPLSRYSLALLTRSSTYDTTAAQRDLGYIPVTDLGTGLLGLKAWVESMGGTAEFVRTLH